MTIKENAWSIYLELSLRQCRWQTCGTLSSAATSNWGCLPRLRAKMSFQNCCKMWICRLGSIYGSRMIRCYTTFSSSISGILEQSVYVTMDRTRWTNSTACSLPGLKSLRFLSLLTSEAYCLYYRRQWRTGLTTTNTEWIWGGPCDNWNVPASQEIAVSNATSCVEAQGGHIEHFL